MVWVHVAVRPPLSVAVNVREIVPTLQELMVIVESWRMVKLPQLSVTVGMASVGIVLQSTVTFGGTPVITGFSLSDVVIT